MFTGSCVPPCAVYVGSVRCSVRGQCALQCAWAVCVGSIVVTEARLPSVPYRSTVVDLGILLGKQACCTTTAIHHVVVVSQTKKLFFAAARACTNVAAEGSAETVRRVVGTDGFDSISFGR
jgi:hypothetical protein